MTPASSPPSRQLGQTLPLVAVFMVVIVALAGLVIDLGNVERVRAQMQSAADAAATGGASSLLGSIPSSVSMGETTATHYGMAADGVNQVAGIDLSKVSQEIDVHCDTEYSACNDETGPNTVTVHETAQVPTFFMSIFGIDSIGVSVDAEACAPCTASPYDIMLVLDHTGSMNDLAGASNGESKIDNLKAGLLDGFIPALDPTVDRLGLVVFPPVTDSWGVCRPIVGWPPDFYSDPTRRYLLESLQGGFLNNDGSINQASPVIQDIQCLSAVGATDYADPLEVAQQQLDADGRPGVPKVVVMISDGAADKVDDPECLVSPNDIPFCNQPCQDGIDDSAGLQNDGIAVYAIAYGNLGNDIDCEYSQGYIHGTNPPDPMTGYEAMQQIASPGDYLFDPDPTQLKYILRQVSTAIVGGLTSRLTK